MGGDERLLSRLDFDQSFGTAINRFCCQAVIGHPLTLCGKGHQKRGFLPLRDSIQCLTLGLENPPEKGEYRVFNQLEEVYGIADLAMKVQRVASDLGIAVEIDCIENPRVELQEHYYKPDHRRLLDLGYRPTHDMEGELRIMLADLLKYRQRIEAARGVLVPDICWDGTRRRLRSLEAPVGSAS
jgi:UDP-sulfoquinovose synthase